MIPDDLNLFTFFEKQDILKDALLANYKTIKSVEKILGCCDRPSNSSAYYSGMELLPILENSPRAPSGSRYIGSSLLRGKPPLFFPSFAIIFSGEYFESLAAQGRNRFSWYYGNIFDSRNGMDIKKRTILSCMVKTI